MRMDKTPTPLFSYPIPQIPPAVIITVEYDPLCLKEELYGEKLRESGVKVSIKRFLEVGHGFLDPPLSELDQKIAWTKEIKGLI